MKKGLLEGNVSSRLSFLSRKPKEHTKIKD